ncbi:ParB family chromosome partitioning protein [Palleronia aestuarii]|uniref:ParB family chromosome partitioning protein n=1 Tax=Palleronia aestuarii TaxID=568105 RepID=A0A2W7NLI6_9RHOB|nr:ParB/RepB/Spo0J family partition protein [Palleronia aestuarii]PZX18967.1 ParB family chromosome partitioning protein [Palleronia aestuarii]
MMEKRERRGLGRGLTALMADVDYNDGEQERRRVPEMHIPIEQIEPNSDQPRRSFESESLEELAASISQRGIIQPLIVRRHPEGGDRYQIVAGERRWRAAQIAQKHDVPVIVRELDDTEVLEVAIIENIQRSDLNPVDEASGYRQLMERFGHTQEQMATALGKSRSHIANALRLLNLPADVLALLAQGKLSAGHARALVPLENASELARQIVAKNLSVRDVETLTRKPKTRPRSSDGGEVREKDADTRALESDLKANLGMGVSIEHKPGRESGKVVITYRNLTELDDLCRILSESQNA